MEEVVQVWRDEKLQELGPNMQALLPHAPPCYFWDTTLTYLDNLGNGPYLVDLSIIPMYYHDANTLLPLPHTPLEGFHFVLSHHEKLIEDSPSLDVDAHKLAPSNDD